MKTRLLILTALVLFPSLFMINEADALILAYSLEDLAEEAEFVVIGEVIEISPLVPGYLLLFTDGSDRFQFDVTLSVEADLDGKYGKDTIAFRIHDSREEFGDHIEDEQNFEIGERVLVFIGKKESDSVGDAHFVTGVTQGKYLLKDGIAFGTHFPEGISEDELISKIKDMRDVDENVQFDCFLTEYWNGTKCVPHDFETSIESEPRPSDFRETNEENSSVIVLIQSLGAILIVFFIVLYAIKKRRKNDYR